jgi:hypothetical protein
LNWAFFLTHLINTLSNSKVEAAEEVDLYLKAT